MLPRISFGTNNDEQLRTYTENTLNKFAWEGLWVLVFGVKKLENDQYEAFKEKYDSIRIKKHKNKEDDLNKLYDKMEQGLKYIGCTAIEDKL